MSKTSKIFVSIVVVVALIVGIYYIFLRVDNVEMKSEVSEEPIPKEDTKKMAFSEFVQGGGSYKCEVKQAMSDFDNAGTVYINGEKMRGEFSTIAEGRTMQTSFIFKDGYSYTWSSMAPNMGMKMKVVKTTPENANAEAEGTYSWDASQIGDYNCVAWTVEESKFTLPVGVTFKEIGAK